MFFNPRIAIELQLPLLLRFAYVDKISEAKRPGPPMKSERFHGTNPRQSVWIVWGVGLLAPLLSCCLPTGRKQEAGLYSGVKRILLTPAGINGELSGNEFMWDDIKSRVKTIYFAQHNFFIFEKQKFIWIS